MRIDELKERETKHMSQTRSVSINSKHSPNSLFSGTVEIYCLGEMISPSQKIRQCIFGKEI